MRGTIAGPLAALVATLAASLWTAPCEAAPPWVDRRITPPQGQWDFDFGLGIAHVGNPQYGSAAGVNMELGVGLTDRVELGVRTGLRFGDDFERGMEGDDYGRLFDRQYMAGDGGDAVLANPEVRVRWAFLEGEVGEMGLEGRLLLPIASGTYAGFEPGLPIALHLGNKVRLDTGVWTPIIFYPQPSAELDLSVPVDVWIQATPRLWLGPMTGLYFRRINSDPNDPEVTSLSLGFGLGYQITRYLDFKTMFLFPTINQDSSVFGVGAGVQIRIE